MEIDINSLEKEKVYCNACLKANKIVECKFDLESQIYKRSESCIASKHKYSLRYFDKYGWSVCQGFGLKSTPRGEITKRKQGKGECSICKKEVEKRDAFSRGINCGCHDKWYKEHNNSEAISKFREKLGKSNLNQQGYCSSALCKNPGVFHEKLNIVGFCKDCQENQLNEVHLLNQQKGNCSICNQKVEFRNSCGVCSNCQSETMKKVRNDFSELFDKSKVSYSSLRKKKLYEEIYKQIIEIPIDLNGVDLYRNKLGAIGLYGKFKKDGKRYALTAGKSVNLHREIRSFYHRINHPELQKPYGFVLPSNDKIDNDYGRWYDITHDYCDFEIVIIYSGENEAEAYLYEASWALANDAIFKKDKNYKKIKGTHGYWMW